ncbi:MAG: DUF4328 domain-containing protein [Crocinitomicaceae bacterium]
MKNVLDNAQRAKTAITCFYILLGCYALMLVSNVMEYMLLSKGSFGIAEANSNDQRQLLITLLSMIAQIVVIVVFIQWFRRAYHNLHKAGVKNLNMTEGWAAGAWFVPIMSLFKPFQIMKDIWIETKKYVSRKSSTLHEETDQNSSTDLSTVGWWWGTWIASSISANISAQIARRAFTVEQFMNSNMLALFSDITGIVCIFLVIKMIKESQQDQNKFLEAWKAGEDESTFEISSSDDILD